jgi:hypothetical protein
MSAVAEGSSDRAIQKPMSRTALDSCVAGLIRTRERERPGYRFSYQAEPTGTAAEPQSDSPRANQGRHPSR